MVDGAEPAKPAKPALSPDEDINVLKKQIEDSVKENKAAREKDVQELQKKAEEKRQQEEREMAGEKGKSPPAAGKPPKTGTGSPKKPS
jgi:small-conductance mechanosensitive channel